MDLLKYIGPLLAATWDNDNRPVPGFFQCLHKFPKWVTILGNKGYIGTSRLYPNCNDVLITPIMKGRKTSQHHELEMQAKKDL